MRISATDLPWSIIDDSIMRTTSDWLNLIPNGSAFSFPAPAQTHVIWIYVKKEIRARLLRLVTFVKRERKQTEKKRKRVETQWWISDRINRRLMVTATYDLYCLQDEVLQLSNEDFYEFVIQVAGKLEADILKIQGIRSARALLRSTDPLAIFRLECDAVAELKKEAFWQCNDGQFVVKQGIELNLQILADTLKEKHNKYIRKIQQRQRAPSTLVTTSVANLAGTHGSSNHLLSEVLSASSATSARTVPSEEMTQSHSSISTPQLSTDHIGTIEGLIAKQSGKMFHSTILKCNEHYQLSFANDNQRLRAIKRCKCGATISLLLRDQTSSFILSNYHSHLTNSDCSMVTKILKEERKLRQRTNDVQSRPMLGSGRYPSTKSLEDTINSTSADENDVAAIESFDTVTHALTTADTKRKHVNTCSSSIKTSASNKKLKRDK